jgi:transposase
MGSTIGRPRALTDDQIHIILDCHRRYVEWKALRASFKSQRELAREFGVSQSAISRVVRQKGVFKRSEVAVQK